MLTPRNILLAALVLAVLLGVVYMLDPTFGGLLPRKLERFMNGGNGAIAGASGSAATSGSASAAASVNGELAGSFVQPGSQMAAAIKGNHHVLASIAEGNESENGNNGNNGNNGSNNGNNGSNNEEGFQNLSPSPMPFPDAEKPANCYPKNQLAPQELLPSDPNSKWAQVNPMGAGDIAGKNFLNAGALIGVNTVGQSLRNASWDLRSEPPNPQQQVSPWLQTTISPDLQRRPLEIA